MKAFTFPRYGSPDVLELTDVDDPVPGDGEILVRVRAASVNPRDWHILRGLPYVMRLKFGLRAPRTFGLGSDIAGVVEAVGSSVTQFEPGDEVMADTVTGAFAEQVCVAADLAAPKPADLSFEEAAAVPLAGVTALQGLRDAAVVRAGQEVLVIGASGGVGTFAVQLAKDIGANVTGVCSTANVDLVRSLGADHVIDYSRDDVFGGGRTYDVVFQLGGTASPARCRRVLTRDGVLLVSSGESEGRWIGPIGRIARAVIVSPFVSQRLVAFEAAASGADLRILAELIEAGKIRPVVGRTCSFDDVPEAVRSIEDAHTRGKLTITM